MNPVSFLLSAADVVSVRLFVCSTFVFKRLSYTASFWRRFLFPYSGLPQPTDDCGWFEVTAIRGPTMYSLRVFERVGRWVAGAQPISLVLDGVLPAVLLVFSLLAYGRIPYTTSLYRRLVSLYVGFRESTYNCIGTVVWWPLATSSLSRRLASRSTSLIRPLCDACPSMAPGPIIWAPFCVCPFSLSGSFDASSGEYIFVLRFCGLADVFVNFLLVSSFVFERLPYAASP